MRRPWRPLASFWWIRHVRHAATSQVRGLTLWRIAIVWRIGAATREVWRHLMLLGVQPGIGKSGVAVSADMWRMAVAVSATDSPPLTCGVADVADSSGDGGK